MSPVIPIIIGWEIIALLLLASAPLITVVLRNAYRQATIWYEMKEEEARKIQEDIGKRLDRYFGPADRLKDLPVRGDLIVPGEGGNGEIIPQKVARDRGMTNSGKFVWLQDPLRPTDWSATIIQAFPAMINHGGHPIQDPNQNQNPNNQNPIVVSIPIPGTNPFHIPTNVFYPDGLPSPTEGPPTPTFGPANQLAEVTDSCKPWPPGGPFWDRNNPGGGSSGVPVTGKTAAPRLKIAVGDAKRDDVLVGVAGRVVLQPTVVVYSKGLPDIASGSTTAAISVRGFVTNNTRFTLMMKEEGDKRAGYAAHGLALANSIVCFPGQTIQVGGQSDGAGVEVLFRFAVWDIPYLADHANLPAGAKEAVDAIEQDSRGLAAFVMKEGETSNWVSNLYLFIDIPKVGSSKIKCSEKTREDIRNLSDPGDIASYDLLSGSDHQMTGINVQATFKVDYGSHPAASFVLSNKA